MSNEILKIIGFATILSNAFLNLFLFFKYSLSNGGFDALCHVMNLILSAMIISTTKIRE